METQKEFFLNERSLAFTRRNLVVEASLRDFSLLAG
jgi:hypothetical protein